MKRESIKAALAGGLLLVSSFAAVADAVLVQGSAVAIRESDVSADAVRIPQESRGMVLAQPQTVTQIARNLYVRRVMAQEAEATGLDKDADVAAALRVARDKVLSDAMLARVNAQHTPSDATLEGLARNAYNAKPERFMQPEQIQVRHILIAGKTPESKQQAEQLLSDLRAGADFAVLAKERSADKGSAERGGDLGLFARGRMVPEFDQAAFALAAPGDMSGVVETQFGFHVLRLEARQAAGPQTFEQVAPRLKQEIRENLQHEARVAAAQKAESTGALKAEEVAKFSARWKDALPKQ